MWVGCGETYFVGLVRELVREGCGGQRERERERGYGGVVLLPQLRPLRRLRAVPERGYLARMPVCALLHALVLQRGNVRLLFYFVVSKSDNIFVSWVCGF